MVLITLSDTSFIALFRLERRDRDYKNGHEDEDDRSGIQMHVDGGR